ncbi:MAG: hypothetical protein AAF487_10510 [Bacteroidota bacterium]
MRVWFYSSIVSAIFMFALSFICHGFVLGDFENLSITLGAHLIKSAVAYLLLGLIMVVVFNKFKNRLAHKYFGLFVGVIIGLLFYSFILIFGDSFMNSFIYHSFEKNHILFDYSWQMVEQGLGGLIAARAILFFGSWKKSI